MMNPRFFNSAGENKLQPQKTLRWRIVIVLLLAALFPLALSGFGSWIVFGQLIEEKSFEQMRTIVRSHASAIEANLSENLHLLQLTAEAHSLHQMSRPGRLQQLFENLNSSSGGGFIDLGIIDENGDHLAYVGPYDLQNRNYRDAAWFQEVMTSGAYISDVFLGFRQVPHCVIAVRTLEDGRPWFLRATINSDQFDRLVGGVPLGEGSCAYIVNRDGQYQTAPESGSVLDPGPVREITYHSGVRESRVMDDSKEVIRVTTWINANRWMLVVEQDLAALRAPVNQAIADGALVVAFAILLLVITAFLATWHLTNLIRKANAERDEMSQAFIRSAKLASIGELATGLAHEINNPLAVISAEQTNISDLLQEMKGSEQDRREILDSVSRCKAQVQRCAGITRKMLQFGRRRESHLEPVDVAARLDDIAALMERRTRVRNIAIEVSVEDNLPRVFVDAVELEQVLVNLINNAIDALPNGGRILLKARRGDRDVHLDVSDNGTGISAEDKEHIFEPFYTTKDVGKGTGLGLSVCYGIIQSWGGSLSAESERGRGTTIHITLPSGPPEKKQSDSVDNEVNHE